MAGAVKGAAGTKIIEEAAVESFEVEEGADVPVGKGDWEAIVATETGDFVSEESDASRVEDFVVVVAFVFGHVLEASIERDGVGECRPGEI